MRRRALGLSQPELAERIGTSALKISRWERGRRVLLRDAVKLARALSSSLEELWPEAFSIEEPQKAKRKPRQKARLPEAEWRFKPDELKS